MGRVAAFGSLCLLACCSALAGAAELPPAPAKEAGEQGERLQVWADRIVYQSDTGSFVFTGKVLVLKGALRVDCTQMDGKVDPKTRQFISIVATGDVRLSTVDTIKVGPSTERPATTSDAPDAWRALCSHADYDLKVGKIVMTATEGKPRPQLWRASGNGEADTIIFLPDKGEYELIGNPVIRGEIPTGPPKPAKRVEPAKSTQQPQGKEESGTRAAPSEAKQP